ncbi:MAG: hypothetical protein CMM46_15465 [Rhodospirillaceae bacterium]|nr:hypothetical protein [Rhodospirillaceae bacterium]|tara:strand:- start:4882 stop:5655 length:774 start_codon:yes stop_codon:yes gene_type:complete
MTDTAQAVALWRRWELPTWGVVAALIYMAWLAVTDWHAALPIWFLLPAVSVLLCWHGHLQHEVLHGHPTRIVWLNELLVFPALGLWFPYGLYRDSHLAQQTETCQTCPIDDPESFYVTARRWARMSALHKAILGFNNSVLGRFLIGPVLASMVRHRAQRNGFVSTRPRRPWACFTSTNNLHAVHHAMPSVAWYELPAIYRAGRERYLEDKGGFLWNGYRDVFRRHFLRPKDEPVHPYFEDGAAVCFFARPVMGLAET